MGRIEGYCPLFGWVRGVDGVSIAAMGEADVTHRITLYNIDPEYSFSYKKYVSLQLVSAYLGVISCCKWKLTV